MAQSSEQIIETIKRVAVSILYGSGTMLTVFNLSSFKGDKFGLYFKDGNQFWLSLGATLIVAGWLTRNWKKLS